MKSVLTFIVLSVFIVACGREGTVSQGRSAAAAPVPAETDKQTEASDALVGTWTNTGFVSRSPRVRVVQEITFLEDGKGIWTRRCSHMEGDKEKQAVQSYAEFDYERTVDTIRVSSWSETKKTMEIPFLFNSVEVTCGVGASILGKTYDVAIVEGNLELSRSAPDQEHSVLTRVTELR
ncbi:MAG: hypothetical protein KDD39_02620 [Bdellovibrionales bacterium]|nr:hypothetical protein [Bdellovibrionales bacterium]